MGGREGRLLLIAARAAPGYWEPFCEIASRHPRRLAVASGGERLTFDALRARVLSAAAAMPRPDGDGPPPRALIASADSLEVLVRVLAAWAAGATPAVLHEGMPEEAVMESARVLRPAAVFHHRSGIGHRFAIPPGPPPQAHRGGALRAREGLVLATSGSAGRPKLVALTQEGLLLGMRAIIDTTSFGDAERMLVAVPLSHTYGLVPALTAFLAGGSVHLFPPGTPGPILARAIREEEITALQGPPSFHRLFLSFWNGEPFPSLRHFTVGGEPSDPRLLETMARAYPSARGWALYGLTESGSRIGQLPLSDPRHARGGVGRPFAHFEWKIRREEAESGPGELLLRGRGVMLGYLQDDGGYGGLDAEGFFPTRDLFEADGDGCLFFRGRMDDLVKVGGRKVSLHEVEEVLRALPGVSEAACRSEPHSILGRILVAEVAASRGAVLSSEDLRRAMAARLEPHQVPRTIRIVESLARGPTGKTARR